MDSKFKISLIATSFLMLSACGNHKKSTPSAGGDIRTQGICSQETVNLHKELMRKSEEPITRNTRFNQIRQSCINLQNQMGQNSCRKSGGRVREDQLISYSQVSNYCAEIETYASDNNPNPPPRPVPVPPTPNNPRPPRYDNVLMTDLDSRYSLYFQKSFLDSSDLERRNSQMRCQIFVPDSANGYLQNSRTRMTAYTVKTFNGISTYDFSVMMTRSKDLARLVCRARSLYIKVSDVNRLLDGAVQIRQQ